MILAIVDKNIQNVAFDQSLHRLLGQKLCDKSKIYGQI